MPTLLYHWDFRNATSTTILDKVSNAEARVMEKESGDAEYQLNSDGVLLSNPDWSESNLGGVYIDLSGLDTVTNISGDITFEMVLKWHDPDRLGADNNKSWGHLLDMGESDANNRVFIRNMGDDAARGLQLRMENIGGNSNLNGQFVSHSASERLLNGFAEEPILDENTFQHFIFTLVSTDDNCKIYQDASSWGRHQPSGDDDWSFRSVIRSINIIGGDKSLHANHFINATIKYFKIWSGDMSSSQVTTQYDSGNCLLDREFVDATIYQGVYDWIDDPTAHALIHGSIEDWNTSKVGAMNNLFKHDATVSSRGTLSSTSFDSDISNWITSKVSTMSSMFDGCAAFNKNIGGWTVSSVTDMSSMFNDASGFNQDISSWDLGAVTSITGMFKGASTFNNASTSMENWLATHDASLDDFTELFSGAEAFNVALTNWDTSKIINMSSMFKDCKVFNQDLTTDSSKWNVASVANMTNMFSGAAAFNKTLSTWDVSSVVYMNNMFQNSGNFDKDISGGIWDTTSVTNYTNMFSGATNMIANYSAPITPKACYFQAFGCICFLGSEKVRTDQGLFRLDKITTSNTINGYKIKKITKMTNSDNHLIYITRDSLGINVPDKDTYISRNHGIILHNHIIRAKTLENGTSIIKAYRSADTIYNVLTEVHTIMYINNIPCETLNPADPEVMKYI